MKVALKPVIEALSRDANQLEHRAQKLRIISPSLESDAELIDRRVASIRQQVEILEQWEEARARWDRSPFHLELLRFGGANVTWTGDGGGSVQE
jgi:hypothetical protein